MSSQLITWSRTFWSPDSAIGREDEMPRASTLTR
jgi:hypothetical protein